MARQTQEMEMKNETYLGLNIPTIRKVTKAATEEEINEWAAKLRETRVACDDAYECNDPKFLEIQDAYHIVLKTVEKNFLRRDRKEINRRSK
jgi:hypothetical protein